MATKITVNGVSYDGVDAMPPDARRVYEDTLAKMPELADHDGDGIPDVVAQEGVSVRHGTLVRKKFVINGTTYDDEAAMPADVRRVYEQAMRAATTGSPTVKKNEINFSFQLTGPGFTVRKRSGTPATVTEPPPVAMSAPESGSGGSTAAPIEPTGSGGGLRMLLVVGACVAAGVMLWLAMRGH